MLNQFIDSLIKVNKEIAVVVVAALPIFELRGSMPLAFALGFTPAKAFWLSIFGNMLPVVPILFFLQPFVNRFRHIKFVERFFNWLFEKTKAKASLVEKFETVGLMLFVAVPLPMTGAWSGCVAATLFRIRFRYAFLAIFFGVMLAGLIVLALCMTGKGMLVK